MSKPHGRRPPPSGRTNLASCIVATIFLIFVVIVALIVYFTVFKPKEPKIAVNAVQLPSFAISNGTANFTFSQYVAVRNPNKASFSHYDSTLQLIYSGNQVGFMFIPAGKIEAGQTQYMAATFAVQSFPVADQRAMGVEMGTGTGMSPGTGTGMLPGTGTGMVPGTGTGMVPGTGTGMVPGTGTGMVPGMLPGMGTGTGMGSTFTGGGANGYRVGPTMEIESKMEMVGRVRVLHVFTHHVNARAACKVAVAVSDGSVLGFHC
ncbi:hypothetical protein FNV43_RR09433 [Rhamnella rubrinervis]|uniref:Late embryogenesis abundant protein LEA-2 subgroup domain-containing protein n=1 Tax=Rhamnella rubrinervis TaxID=2594499 RepID=A0A8K0HAG3_9ROSA|nr:hypothetical protein FNV43_RR09433 [Rhamnella rubrinervis]